MPPEAEGPPIYFTNARTLAELRDEFVQDIRLRMDKLAGYMEAVARNKAEKARYASAMRELEAMYHYWQKIDIRHSKKGAK